MNAYKIDKNVPVPKRLKKRKRGGTSKGAAAVLARLKVGDSFKITTLEESTRTGMYNSARLLKIKILVSRLHQRVWRIK